MVSSTPRPHFTPGKDTVPILQEAGWVPGPVWTGGKSRPHRDSIPDRPARSQSLYRLSYPAHDCHINGKPNSHQRTDFKRFIWPHLVISKLPNNFLIIVFQLCVGYPNAQFTSCWGTADNEDVCSMHHGPCSDGTVPSQSALP